MIKPFTTQQIRELNVELRKLSVGYVDLTWQRVVLTDEDLVLEPGEPPISIKHQQFQGIQYLAQTRPAMSLLQTQHVDGFDVERFLAAHLNAFGSPILFVEADADPDKPWRRGIPVPRPSQTNKWLEEFNLATFAECKRRGVQPIPCEPTFTNGLAARLEGLERYFDSLRPRTDGDPEVKAALLTVLHFYMEVFRAWGVVDQVGLWLKDPAVQAVVGDSTARKPLLMGYAHELEYIIMFHYIGLDTSVAMLQRHMPPGTFPVDDALFWSRYATHLRIMQIPLLDLREAAYPY